MAEWFTPNPRNTISVPGVDRTFRRDLVLAILLLPMFASMLAVSSLNVALPSIGTGLGASSTDLQWLLSGYALAFGVVQIPAGRLGDVTGRGTWFVVGVALFTLSSTACGFAPDPTWLNVARLSQGLGAGIFLPQVNGMIQQYFSGGGRAKAYAFFGMTISASVAVGPFLTGVIIQTLGERLGWRVSFLLNVPVGVLALVLALLCFPFETERARRRMEGVRPPLDLDPVGALLVTGTSFAVMWPFLTRGSVWWWALLPVGGLLLWAWVAWERAYAARGGEPMVDLALFNFPSFSFQTAINSFLLLGGTSVFVTIALLMQGGLGMTAFATGVIGLPNAIVSAFAAWWSGRHAMRHGRLLVVVGLACHILHTLGTIVVIATGVSIWWLLGILVLGGIGFGLIGSPNQTLALIDVPEARAGSAGAVKATAERIAIAMGNASMMAVFFTVTAASGYRTGAVATLSVIAAIVACGLAFAVYDLRRRGRAVLVHADR